MSNKIHSLALFLTCFMISPTPGVPQIQEKISHIPKSICERHDVRYPEKIVTGQPDTETLKQYDKVHDIPLLEIDPTQIDTTKDTNWYKFWTRVPLPNGFAAPIQIEDFDHNGQPELYGIYTRSGLDFMSDIYEVDTTG